MTVTSQPCKMEEDEVEVVEEEVCLCLSTSGIMVVAPRV